MTRVIWRANRSIWRIRGVRPASRPSRAARRSGRVSVPVARGHDDAGALPPATKVPENAIERRSPSGASAATGSGDFSTGTDSPVSAASSICRLRARIRRRSAGTRSPASSRTRSPGTIASAGIDPRRPSRITEAAGSIMVADRVQRLLGPALLDEADDGVDDDHGQDDQRIDPMAEQCRDRRPSRGGRRSADCGSGASSRTTPGGTRPGPGGWGRVRRDAPGLGGGEAVGAPGERGHGLRRRHGVPCRLVRRRRAMHDLPRSRQLRRSKTAGACAPFRYSRRVRKRYLRAAVCRKDANAGSRRALDLPRRGGAPVRSGPVSVALFSPAGRGIRCSA